MHYEASTTLDAARFLFIEQPFSELGASCDDIELVSRIEQATGSGSIAVLRHPDACLDRFGMLGIASIDTQGSQRDFIMDHASSLRTITLVTINALDAFAPVEELGSDYRSIILEYVAWGTFRRVRTPEDHEALMQLISSCNEDTLRCFAPRSLAELDIVAKYCARRNGDAS